MDDTCTLLPSYKVDDFHNYLNNVEPCIQFIVKVMVDAKLPFLNVLMEHETDGSIATTVYRKRTDTDKYLNFTLHHPLARKFRPAAVFHALAS